MVRHDAKRIERVLTDHPGMGIIRHADAGYDEANAFAPEEGCEDSDGRIEPSLLHTVAPDLAGPVSRASPPRFGGRGRRRTAAKRRCYPKLYVMTTNMTSTRSQGARPVLLVNIGQLLTAALQSDKAAHVGPRTSANSVS